MATAALNDLLQHRLLTDSQVELVQRHPLSVNLTRAAQRQVLLRLLRKPATTQETLGRCLEEGECVVHEALLLRGDLPGEICAALATRGFNQSIRNRAKQQLQRRGTIVWLRKFTP